MSSADPSKGFVIGFFEWFGELGLFSWHVLRAAVTPPFEFRELVRQIDEIGSKSFPLVALAGAAIGVVLSLETRDSLVRFGAKVRCFPPPSCSRSSTRSVRSLLAWWSAGEWARASARSWGR